MMRVRPFIPAALLAVCFGLPARLNAQTHTFSVGAAVPVGEFAGYSTVGVAADYAYSTGGLGQLFGIRAAARFVGFPTMTDRVCDFSATSGCRRTYDVTSQRTQLAVSVGPQLTFETLPLRPHLFATGGGSIFRSATGGLPSGNSDYISAALDWGGGAGLWFGGRDDDLSFELTARYEGGTSVRYAPRGHFGQAGTDSLTFSPESGRRDLVIVAFGVSLAF